MRGWLVIVILVSVVEGTWIPFGIGGLQSNAMISLSTSAKRSNDIILVSNNADCSWVSHTITWQPDIPNIVYNDTRKCLYPAASLVSLTRFQRNGELKGYILVVKLPNDKFAKLVFDIYGAIISEREILYGTLILGSPTIIEDLTGNTVGIFGFMVNRGMREYYWQLFLSNGGTRPITSFSTATAMPVWSAVSAVAADINDNMSLAIVYSVLGILYVTFRPSILDPSPVLGSHRFIVRNGTGNIKKVFAAPFPSGFGVIACRDDYFISANAYGASRDNTNAMLFSGGHAVSFSPPSILCEHMVFATLGNYTVFSWITNFSKTLHVVSMRPRNDKMVGWLSSPVFVVGISPANYANVSLAIIDTNTVAVGHDNYVTILSLVNMTKSPLTSAPSTMSPTEVPGSNTYAPTSLPVRTPTSSPTIVPTSSPTIVPTSSPTIVPTSSPTIVPTSLPITPTIVPTSLPTIVPTSLPTSTPTALSTSIPITDRPVESTKVPSQTAEPTSSPNPNAPLGSASTLILIIIIISVTAVSMLCCIVAYLIKKRKQSLSPIQDILLEERTTETTVSVIGENNLGLRSGNGSWVATQKIGRGAFGDVYSILMTNGKTEAVKVLASLSQEAIANYMNEFKIIRGLSHPNLIYYIDAERNDNDLYIVMEYTPEGSLADLIIRCVRLSLSICKQYTRDILSGLVYLHSNRLLHRDIKAANVLIKGGVCKLADFGCVKLIDSTVAAASTVVGTPRWMAPEIINGNATYGSEADIWSVGCTINEMLTGHPPWPMLSNTWKMLYHVANSEPMLEMELLDSPTIDLLKKIFSRNACDRPSAVNLLSSEWITSPGDSSLESDGSLLLV